jgi:hypothetical protein
MNTQKMLAAAFVIVIAVFTGNVTADDGYQPSGFTPRGGVEGGDALVLPRGDILNVRNIQGGVIGNTNLDIGAGSTQHPGNIVMNWDVGRKTLIYDGKKRLLASFGPHGIVFYVKPKYRPRSSP